MSDRASFEGDQNVEIVITPEALARSIVNDHAALSILVQAIIVELLKQARRLKDLFGKYAGS